MNKAMVFAVLGIAGCISIQCMKERVNPLDAKGPKFDPALVESLYAVQVPPQIQFAVEGLDSAVGILTSDTVALSWAGQNPDKPMEYRWRLTSYAGHQWSVWGADTGAAVYLDDTTYTLEIAYRYAGGLDTTHTETIEFSVNALAGPAVYLYPRTAVIGSADSTVTLELRGLGIPRAKFLHLTITGLPIDSAAAAASGNLALQADSVVDLVILSTGDLADGRLATFRLNTKNVTDIATVRLAGCSVSDSVRQPLAVSTRNGTIIRKQEELP
jgi:hypothetical protein